MKPVDVKWTIYIDFNKENNEEGPKFKVLVKLSSCKNIKIWRRFPKGYVLNWYEKVFVITKVKNNLLWAYVISDLKGKEVYGIFYKKKLQKPNQREFRVEKVIKRKSDKLYVKWKGYNSSFSSWIDKKDTI